MESVFKNLQPERIWFYFEEICQIPRLSKQEDEIAAYLIDFAKAHDLEYKSDSIGNVLIKKKAQPGREQAKSVILQSHMDMVGEKNKGIDHDFAKDPIKPYIEEPWVKARGTTLGADDGIGIAAQLAVLESDSIAHGPLECLFTRDEETGLTGAFALSGDFFESRILVNLDSEDWGEIFIGCAGGRDTNAVFGFDWENSPADHEAFEIAITGLQGGHSGDEIHKGLGNSIKIINRVLYGLSEICHIRLALIDGGNARNAIPREAFATVLVPKDAADKLITFVKDFEKKSKNELSVTAPDLNVKTKKINEVPGRVIDLKLQERLIMALYALPHGEMKWSQTIENLVETSTNLATIKMDDRQIRVGTSQRSSTESELTNIVNHVQSVFKLARAAVNSTDGYPGWEPNLDSEILNVATKSYSKLFRQEPEVKAIHAGLECGLFSEKYPGLDMISIGPTIKGAHTPEERLDIRSTQGVLGLFSGYIGGSGIESFFIKFYNKNYPSGAFRRELL